MAQGRPIVRGLMVLSIAVVMFFAAATALTVGTDGKLGNLLSLGSKVGVVEVKGVISESDDVVDALKRFEKSPAIKAIVVRIESPGGGVAPSQEIYDAIRKVRESKPVVASMGGVAASGGYYIASACDTIVANPGTLTGSIGVIMELGNVEGLLQKLGVQPEIIKAGAYKDMGSLVRPMTDGERGLFQEMLDSVHTQFITAVAAGRGMNKDQVRALADGRIFSGEQAKVAGLVDELGGFEDALELAASKGGIEGEPRVTEARSSKEPWWWRLLFNFAPIPPFSSYRAFGLQIVYEGPFLR
ncbi:MAG: signal peptide peptidase SppA [Deltaproteobacteria bacterium]|nr:signal peptide peptidase SppA [Deltaproteobacteria bacterium]